MYYFPLLLVLLTGIHDSLCFSPLFKRFPIHHKTEIAFNSSHNGSDSLPLGPMSLCGDWQQLGVKCYKIIDMLTTRDNARQQCKLLDKSAALVQVKSRDDQDALLKMVRQYKALSIPVKVSHSHRNDTNSSMVSFVWIEVSTEGNTQDSHRRPFEQKPGFTNWDEDSPDLINKNMCVQISLDTGKWSDVKCRRKNLVVCEKGTELTTNSVFTLIRNVFTKLNARINKQEKDIEEIRKKVDDMKGQGKIKLTQIPKFLP